MTTLKELAAQNGINAGRGSNTLWFAPEQLYVQPGWNERGGDAYWSSTEAAEIIERIADSILANGYDPTKPISVKKKKVNGIDVPTVIDGEHRLRGAKRAKEKSSRADILVLTMSIPEGMDEFDELAMQARANSGIPNTPSQTANQVKRLQKMRPDSSNQDIATAIGKTIQTVNNAFAILELPIAVRAMVDSGSISATFAIAFVKEYGDQAVALLEAKLEGLRLEGKKKVTAKHFKSEAPAMPTKVESTSVEPLEAVEPIKDDFTDVEVVEKSIDVDESIKKKPTLKQLAKDIIESAIYGECDSTHKWIGVEVQHWQQLLELGK